MPNGDPLGVAEPVPSKSTALMAALKGAIPGAIAGGGLGALRAGLGGAGDYLRQTLAGALLGGVGTGGATYLSKAGPFARGGMGAKALESGGEEMTKAMLTGASIPSAAARSVAAGTRSLLTGRGRFTPEQQEALVQQFLQSTLPTTVGWQKRIGLARKTVGQLGADRPRRALRGLRTLGKVAPDAATQALVGDAIERLTGGRFRGGEQQQALGALSQGLGRRADLYEKILPTLQELHKLKQRYAGKEIAFPELSKRFGIVTGRFGRSGAEAERLRSFIREIIARPVSAKPTTAIERATMETPQLGELLESATRRGR